MIVFSVCGAVVSFVAEIAKARGSWLSSYEYLRLGHADEMMKELVHYSGHGDVVLDDGRNVRMELPMMLAFGSHFDKRGKPLDLTAKSLLEDRRSVPHHFLDSGAFTLWTKSAQYAEANGLDRWAYYDTDEFWAYMDAYAEFVKKYKIAIDLYANVDAIPNPKLTWRNQKYLEEKHGLHPVPVVHCGTDLKWLKRYIDTGYELIGLGGLAGKVRRENMIYWLDRCFDMVCDTPDRKPRIKLHGFAITSYPLIIRYPWWSVDSVTWAKAGGFGRVLIPHKRNGEFTFGVTPHCVVMSIESDTRRDEKKHHYLTMRKTEQAIIREWFDKIGVPLGKWKEVNGEVEIEEYGVITRHTERRLANLLFFERLREWLPEWPWPFRANVKQGFAL